MPRPRPGETGCCGTSVRTQQSGTEGATRVRAGARGSPAPEGATRVGAGARGSPAPGPVLTHKRDNDGVTLESPQGLLVQPPSGTCLEDGMAFAKTASQESAAQPSLREPLPSSEGTGPCRHSKEAAWTTCPFTRFVRVTNIYSVPRAVSHSPGLRSSWPRAEE